MMTKRVVGVTAIALALSMVAQNIMFAVTGAPGYGDPIDTVIAWHEQNRAVVAIAVAQEAVHVPLLLGVLAGLHGIIGRRGGAGADWSRLAMLAGATVAAILALYSVTWIGAVLATAESADARALFSMLWQLHAAAFALSLPALGVTMIAVALATHRSRLSPPWQRLLALTGGVLLLAVGAFSLDIAAGSPMLFVGLPGLAVWIIWLLVTGVRMLRAGGADGSVRASTGTGGR
ncbi:hypothetical protein [Microcella humidisoli]|uniref:DUF4386 family protein n=1 Tax=Microcella humidisoli TaxID=2963406 RepID=A0ABY5FXH9_9MICO|nr:hypothetical protein [Microcella humidisoli]UTT62984.1 hypothetical protein NNL39_02435 [Microcella humidisoli]